MKEGGAPEDRANFPAAIPTAEAYGSQIAIRWDHSAPWARTHGMAVIPDNAHHHPHRPQVLTPTLGPSSPPPP